MGGDERLDDAVDEVCVRVERAFKLLGPGRSQILEKDTKNSNQLPLNVVIHTAGDGLTDPSGPRTARLTNSSLIPDSSNFRTRFSTAYLTTSFTSPPASSFPILSSNSQRSPSWKAERRESRSDEARFTRPSGFWRLSVE